MNQGNRSHSHAFLVFFILTWSYFFQVLPLQNRVSELEVRMLQLEGVEAGHGS